jgi:hypothetical protein
MASREPAPTNRYNRIRIGDVGFVRRGQFNLLFSAGCPLGERQPGIHVPLTFEELHVGASVFRQPLDPRPLKTDTVHKIKVDASAIGMCVQFFELSSHRISLTSCQTPGTWYIFRL